jgi:hypothetical protein
LFKAAEIKSKCNVSVIDSFIAALASTMNATLVDKDPEFEKLSPEINRIPLKYKERKSNFYITVTLVIMLAGIWRLKDVYGVDLNGCRT